MTSSFRAGVVVFTIEDACEIVANRPASSQRTAELTAVAAGGLLAVRWLAPERGKLTTGWPALLDSAFAVGLVALVAVLAIALGRRALRLARLDGVLGGAEGFAIEAALGLGLMALSFLLLGLLGLFHSAVLIACAFLLGLLAWPEIGRAALDGMHLPRRVFAEAPRRGLLRSQRHRHWRRCPALQRDGGPWTFYGERRLDVPPPGSKDVYGGGSAFPNS